MFYYFLHLFCNFGIIAKVMSRWFSQCTIVACLHLSREGICLQCWHHLGIVAFFCKLLSNWCSCAYILLNKLNMLGSLLLCFSSFPFSFLVKLHFLRWSLSCHCYFVLVCHNDPQVSIWRCLYGICSNHQQNQSSLIHIHWKLLVLTIVMRYLRQEIG